MNAKGWTMTALAAGGLVLGLRMIGGSHHDPAPDEKLTARFEELCEIAKHGATEPVAGVRALGTYMGNHAGEMFGALADTIALIEKIPDDDEHDDRAYIARERIHKPLRACERDWEKFSRAVDRSPEATELVEHAMVRLNRTLEIVFSGKSLQLHGLPRQLEQLFDEL